MSRVTLRTSTILINTEGKTRVYRTLKDVPPPLRRKLVQSTSGANSATILIADRKGREELARAVRGLPGKTTRPAAPMGSVAEKAERWRKRLIPFGVWAEVLVAGGLGVLIWLLVTSR